MNFENKVILITGASSGIGADAALYLAKLGGKVALVGRNEKNLNAVVDNIMKTKSPTPLKIVADVVKDGRKIIDETIKHFGKLDVLVNSAGIGKRTSIMESSMDLYDEIMDTNLRSAVVLIKLAVPHLQVTKGNIVNVSSIAGLVASSGRAFYCMSKAALDHFSNVAAIEFGPKGIRVNSVNPGVIDTPIFRKAGADEEAVKEIFKSCEDSYPLRRAGLVSDTSAAIAYLASDAASFVTGIQLRVDGGAVVAGAY